MFPSGTRLLSSMFVILEDRLSFEQRANTRITERVLEDFLRVSDVQVFTVPVRLNLLDLFDPLAREAGMFRHRIG